MDEEDLARIVTLAVREQPSAQLRHKLKIMLLNSLVGTSNTVAGTSGRLAKIKLLADLLKQAGPDEIELAIAYLSGTIRQAKVGVGWATLQKAKSHVATSASLQLRDIDAVLEQIAT